MEREESGPSPSCRKALRLESSTSTNGLRAGRCSPRRFFLGRRQLLPILKVHSAPGMSCGQKALGGMRGQDVEAIVFPGIEGGSFRR